MFDLTAFYLARIQFAFTVSFHIIFPSITIGLGLYLVVLEGLWLYSKKDVWRELYHFWLKIFAVNFGMGVVSGLVMAYQFGTNWSGFTAFAGSINGPMLTYEVLSAFFLEAGFLGVMLFGWNRVGAGLHFFSTCMVSLGTLISTFWILASNSFLQTPAGYKVENNQLVPTDWLHAIFNPSFPYRMAHMTMAAIIAAAFMIGASGAWHLLKGNRSPAIKKMFSMAMGMILIAAPLQAFIGDAHGLNTLEYQPAKIAAIEGHWQNKPGEPSPLLLFGVPDMKAEKTRYALEIPYLGSLILTHSLDKQIPGLKSFPPEDRPDSTIIFWSFRIMVALGLLMVATGIWGLVLRLKGKLYEQTLFHRFVLTMGPSGLLCIIAGWFTTEIGRQPWVVYGLLRTKDAVALHSTLHMSVTLIAFVVIYSFVFGIGVNYLIRLIGKGPQALADPVDPHPSRTPARPLSAIDDNPVSPDPKNLRSSN
ncbi:MAG: cytochrome ubiquinol oxidase subunit I [Pseudomonadota bacterium]|uniref:cytochrome ubiquinol oxidase subunit I n=1 Tax=Gallaecimonas pentaromativorans TaxID=584787 RepID=UPI00067ED709|nr:cytochrome ubiquinol oxidase subunit I [Gallaecimonas pentaromativorans]MED5525112.1 cytochrome ubiquinol oxidase subunit I [Pseudomonadota bacterium]